MTLDNVALAWTAGLLAIWGFYGLLYIIRTTDEARARRARPEPTENLPEGWQ